MVHEEGGVDGLRTVAAVPGKVTAQCGVGWRGGTVRLELATVAERDGECGCGVLAMDWGRGAVDGVRQGMAMPTEVVARCGSGASGGEVRLEAANMSATSGAR
uniref:DUF834 domain-containing protein n=1 Tax=Oryza sativa subsp. japonica TaxID=39947 RepID=Q7XHL5_ORYSJ|nr:hypothetical protein [Oryza sativa Japonica Group]BAD30828.1 hypothetical protein [Oryza sativa Japonica Group]